jgi:hypothetical protein
MYPLVESVVSSVVPLFERVLSQINGQDKDIYRDIPPGSGRMKTKYDFGTWAGYNSKHVGDTIPCIWSEGDVEWQEGMTDDEFTKLREEAPKVLPEALEEYTGELERSIAPFSLRGKTIQCIIKLANIHLTADNPEYAGGSWHVEGVTGALLSSLFDWWCSPAMLNERIVASGIYVGRSLALKLPLISASITTKKIFLSRSLRFVSQRVLPHTMNKMTNCAWIYCMG